MAAILEQAYRQEVTKGGRIANIDRETMRHIRLASLWLTKPDMKPSLLLCGGVGNGKTTIARSIVESIRSISMQAKSELFRVIREESLESAAGSEQMKRLAKLPSPSYTTAQNMVDNLGDGNMDNYAYYYNAQLLVIDDFGSEPREIKFYGNTITPVANILTRRYDGRKPSIITTNLDLDGIGQVYGERLLDRIKETFEIISFNNNSYRK